MRKHIIIIAVLSLLIGLGAFGVDKGLRWHRDREATLNHYWKLSKKQAQELREADQNIKNTDRLWLRYRESNRELEAKLKQIEKEITRLRLSKLILENKLKKQDTALSRLQSQNRAYREAKLNQLKTLK